VNEHTDIRNADTENRSGNESKNDYCPNGVLERSTRTGDPQQCDSDTNFDEHSTNSVEVFSNVEELRG
jgi:hypothetical protein